MKSVSGWFVPDNMNNPGSHLRRSGVIEAALDFLPISQRYCAVQAGGHIGIWPKKLSERFEHVFTFEPIDVNMECLLANVADRKNIVVTQGCLGDERKIVEMEFSERNTGKHCIRRHGAKKYTETSMVRLDDDPRITKVDAMFLDVEGYEWQAIMGAEKIVARDKPFLVLEQNGLGARYGHSDELLTRLLTRIGYTEVGEFEEDVLYIHKDKK